MLGPALFGSRRRGDVMISSDTVTDGSGASASSSMIFLAADRASEADADLMIPPTAMVMSIPMV
jgi:hypothetical protein